MLQDAPGQLALVGAGADPAGELQARVGECLDDGVGGAGGGEGGQQMPDGLLDLGVRVKNHAVGVVVDEADGQRLDQLPASRLGQRSAPQTGLEQVQLCL